MDSSGRSRTYPSTTTRFKGNKAKTSAITRAQVPPAGEVPRNDSPLSLTPPDFFPQPSKNINPQLSPLHRRMRETLTPRLPSPPTSPPTSSPSSAQRTPETHPTPSPTTPPPAPTPRSPAPRRANCTGNSTRSAWDRRRIRRAAVAERAGCGCGRGRGGRGGRWGRGGW